MPIPLPILLGLGAGAAATRQGLKMREAAEQRKRETFEWIKAMTEGRPAPSQTAPTTPTPPSQVRQPQQPSSNNASKHLLHRSLTLLRTKHSATSSATKTPYGHRWMKSPSSRRPSLSLLVLRSHLARLTSLTRRLRSFASTASV